MTYIFRKLKIKDSTFRQNSQEKHLFYRVVSLPLLRGITKQPLLQWHPISAKMYHIIQVGSYVA